MADKLYTDVDTDKVTKSDKKKVKKKSRIAKWFREMRSELKKVVWSTPQQVINNTGVALVVIVVSAVFVWVLDQIGLQIFRAILTLGGR